MCIYAHLIKPLLFRLPPETAHGLLARGLGVLESSACLRSGVALKTAPKEYPQLEQVLWGHRFKHPLGLAAGFDKNGRYIQALRSLGFDYVEVGSLTAQPSPGNPSPRLFRLPDDAALINRMGLNNDSLPARLPALRVAGGYALNITKTPGVYGKAAIADMAEALRLAIQLPARYLALNLSCPNTADGKSFEEPDSFNTLMRAMRAAEITSPDSHWKTPWLVKLSADVDPGRLDELLAIGEAVGLDGWIISNTSTRRDGLKTPPKRIEAIGQGGLSGQPIQKASTQLLGQVYQQTRHWSEPPVLIGVGGVSDASSAWEKITHGASLLQSYTGWVYQGPSMPKQIVSGLAERLSQQGYNSLSDAVGSAFN